MSFPQDTNMNLSCLFYSHPPPYYDEPPRGMFCSLYDMWLAWMFYAVFGSTRQSFFCWLLSIWCVFAHRNVFMTVGKAPTFPQGSLGDLEVKTGSVIATSGGFLSSSQQMGVGSPSGLASGGHSTLTSHDFQKGRLGRGHQQADRSPKAWTVPYSVSVLFCCNQESYGCFPRPVYLWLQCSFFFTVRNGQSYITADSYGNI